MESYTLGNLKEQIKKTQVAESVYKEVEKLVAEKNKEIAEQKAKIDAFKTEIAMHDSFGYWINAVTDGNIVIDDPKHMKICIQVTSSDKISYGDQVELKNGYGYYSSAQNDAERDKIEYHKIMSLESIFITIEKDTEPIKEIKHQLIEMLESYADAFYSKMTGSHRQNFKFDKIERITTHYGEREKFELLFKKS